MGTCAEIQETWYFDSSDPNEVKEIEKLKNTLDGEELIKRHEDTFKIVNLTMSYEWSKYIKIEIYLRRHKN